jgi:hypothetical protein
MAIELKFSQIARLAEAISSAFSVPEIKRLLLQLDANPDEFNLDARPIDVALEVAEKFQRRSSADDLVRAMVITNSSNLKLKRFALEVSLTSPTAPSERLESILSNRYPERAGDWRNKMAKIQSGIGRIEVPEDRGIGTGFLVASNLILTNWHVARSVESVAYGLARGGIRFGLEAGESAGRFVPFAEHWNLAFSETADLDFALIRLDAELNDRAPISGPLGALGSKEVAIILQHPEAGELRIAIGTLSNETGSPPRLYYEIDTERGSSGSPVFNGSWELIALHRAGGTKANEGVPLRAIWPRIERFLTRPIATTLPGPTAPSGVFVTEAANAASNQLDCPVPADVGLSKLAGEMRRPAVREAVMRSKIEFERARPGLLRVGNIKRLHEKLHTLQLEFATQLPGVVRQFPNSIPALQSLYRQAQRKMESLRVLLKAARFPGFSPEFVERDLSAILDLVQKALNTRQVGSLEDAACELERLLGIEMPKLDRLIAAAAEDLPLKTLANGLRAIRREGIGPLELERTISALDELSGSLQSLAQQHKAWQRIDDSMRLLTNDIVGQSRGVGAGWRLLRRYLEERCGQGSETIWAIQLLQSMTQLDECLASGNSSGAIEAFLEVRQVAGERFAETDEKLLDECGELLPIAAGMDQLLNQMN